MAVIEFGKFGECHCCDPFEIRMEIDLNSRPEVTIGWLLRDLQSTSERPEFNGIDWGLLSGLSEVTSIQANMPLIEQIPMLSHSIASESITVESTQSARQLTKRTRYYTL